MMMELDNHWSNWWANPGLGLSIGATAVLATSVMLPYKQSLCLGLWLIAEVRAKGVASRLIVRKL